MYTPYTDGQPGTAVLTRYYFGGAYETTGSAWKKYYSFAGQTIAMRDSETNSFKYFLSDHLGSVSVVLSDMGTILEQQRYLPFGEARVMPPYASVTSTDRTYTGQRDLTGTGLMDYNARFYSSYLNQFTQPDTIVPNLYNPQSLNRYSYVLNNPILYSDPSGHCSLSGHWMSDDTDACKWNNIESSISKPSDKCTGDCQDAYRTYRALAHNLNRVPSPEEVLYMTADTEYSVPAAHDPAVRIYGQEGLARSFYSKCKTDGCQGDELYNFLSGYQPWIGWSGQRPGDPTTPESRSQILVATLGSIKDWLMTDMKEITDVQGVAKDKGWIKGLLPGHAAQWFGPFTPTQQCRNRVKPVYPYKSGDGTEFWILPNEEIGNYNAFCK